MGRHNLSYAAVAGSWKTSGTDEWSKGTNKKSGSNKQYTSCSGYSICKGYAFLSQVGREEVCC